MQYEAKTVKEYIAQLPEDRQPVIKKLGAIIKKNIPKGFKEVINYKMPAYVVPYSLYPDGYHCSPELPLPFVSYASQKNFVALYHMGIYANPKLLDWFVKEYPKHCKSKLDMGKSCIRFKMSARLSGGEDIPYDLIGELMTKMTTEDWVKIYENAFKKK